MLKGPDFADWLQQAATCVLECSGSVLHSADERANDLDVLEDDEVGVGAEGDLACRRKTNGHDDATDARAEICECVLVRPEDVMSIFLWLHDRT